MKTVRIRHLIAGGVLAALAVLGAPTSLAQPVPCPDDPANAAAPGSGACASQDSIPDAAPGFPPGTFPGPIIPGPAPGTPGGGDG